MTDLVDYLRDKLKAAKAEDAVTHVRVAHEDLAARYGR